MIDALAYAVVALAGAAVIWGLVSAIANKPPGKAQLLYAAGLEVITVIQSIIAAAKMIGGFRPAELATTIGYLIGIVILIPIGWLWANGGSLLLSSTAARLLDSFQRGPARLAAGRHAPSASGESAIRSVR